MAVSVTCPGCATSYPVTEDIVGKTIRCKKCQETFVARTSKSAVSAGRGDERITTKPSAKATVRDDYDDAPVNGKASGKPRAVPARKPAKTGGNGTMIAVASAGGVLILGLAAALVWALNRGDEPTDGGSAAVVPPKRTQFGVPDAPVIPPVTPGPKTDEPEKPVPPKAVQAAKIEHVSLPGFVRQRRPADFDPAVVHKAKQKAVMLLCRSADGGGWGSGWVAEQNGDERFIVTNAHVVDMKERVKSPPDSIKVYFHAGTDNESILEGRLLAVDHDEDLAVVRVKGRDKKGDPLPEPLKIAPSYDLVPGQKLTTLGFPLGGNFKQIVSTVLDEIKVEVKTRPTTVTGRVPNEKDGSIKYIQVEGGVDGGNSGGAVIDTNGNVVAVVVSEITTTNIKFVIPSEYAYHLLLGRILKLVPGQAVKSGSTVRQPIRSYVADPLHRIARITGEVWTGKPGAVRSASLSAPPPVEGDGPRATIDMTYKRDQDLKLGEAYFTDGEVSLPPLKDGEVYWFQPHYHGRDGKDRWGEAIVVEMGRYPVEAKPVNLSVKHKPASRLDDVRAIEIESRAIVGNEIAAVDQSLKASFTERIDSVERNGDAHVTYQYSNVAFRDKVEDERMRSRYRGLLESAKLMRSKAIITKDGQLKQAKPDLAQVMRGAQVMMEQFDEQVMESLEALSIPLPNKDVSPGETWDTDLHYSVRIGRTPRNIVMRTKAKYVGSRVRDGREEAVIELLGRAELDQGGGGRGGRAGRGESGPNPGGDDSRGGSGASGSGGDDEPNQQRGVRGLGHGAAVVDVQTGHVTFGRVESDMAATFVIPIPQRNGQTRDERVLIGFYQESMGRRSLNKTKPPEFDPERLLPNQKRIYNPLVGAADPSAVSDASPAAELPSGVPVRVTDMKPDAFQKATKASVMVEVTTATGGGSGSGWFAERGIVVTNCHVVDMLSKTDRKPQKIQVYIERGTPNERKLDGELLTVNRRDDLAVIRVKGDNLPEPFAIVGQDSLGNSQRLTIHGFPLGTRIASMVTAGSGTGQNYLTTLKSRPTTVVGRVPNVDGSVKYVQLEGGADPGNSGGPITDADGNVRLVLVAGIPNTEIRFAIPGEYAQRMIHGYPMEVEPGVAFMDGSIPKQPISILFADPLKRLQKVWVDVWVGNPGKPRQGGSKEPKAKEGDGEKMSIEVPFGPDKSGLFMEVKSEIPIPRIAPGQIYYFQPRFLNGSGAMQWGQALPFAPDGPPVERKPAQLMVKHIVNAAPRYLELTSEMSQENRDISQGSDVKGFPLKATYAETIVRKTAKGAALADLKCTNFTWAIFDDDFFEKNPAFAELFDPEIVRLIKQFLGLYKQISTQVVFGSDGRMLNNPAVTMPGGLPARAFALLPDFHNQMLLSLQALSIPLPNKEVAHGHSWSTTTNLFIPASKRMDAGVFELKMKYVGVRDRGGRREAVIEIDGNLTRDKSDKSAELRSKDDPDAKGDELKPDEDPPGVAPFQARGKDDAKGRRPVYGVGHGHAYVDIDGGYVSDCQLFIDLEVEVMAKDKDTKQEFPQVVSGMMKIGMKRLTSAGRAK